MLYSCVLAYGGVVVKLKKIYIYFDLLKKCHYFIWKS